jgi:hypothetical protein
MRHDAVNSAFRKTLPVRYLTIQMSDRASIPLSYQDPASRWFFRGGGKAARKSAPGPHRRQHLGLIERFINAKVLELSRGYALSDQLAMQARMRFSDIRRSSATSA